MAHDSETTGSPPELEPTEVPQVETDFRRIATPIPVPESIPTLRKLRENEAISVACQPPILWDRAEGFQVYDKYGNKWLDWTSGVLVTNSGHGNEEIQEAISRQAKKSMFSYQFPTETRAQLVEKIVDLVPNPLEKVFLLSTGSEVVENAIKLTRGFFSSRHPEKVGIVSFEGAFHGRTFGAQMAGGFPSLKDWIGKPAPGFYQVPFPGGFRTKDQSFGAFKQSLEDQDLASKDIAAVIVEPYQTGGASFVPKQYMKKLATWCKENDVFLVLDEVQASFGRTGKMFCFEHYDVVPDLVLCGKGISSSLPLSAVIGRSDLLDVFSPGEMTSTHSGNLVCCAAALANIRSIQENDLVHNAARVGDILHRELASIRDEHEDVIGVVHGKGLVAGLHIVERESSEPHGKLASEIVKRAVEKGLLLISPIGYGGATVKICPPLTITKQAIKEGAEVLNKAIDKAKSEVY